MMKATPEVPNGTEVSVGSTFHEIHGSTYLERDERNLARLGKSQVLKVLFEYLDPWSILAVHSPQPLANCIRPHSASLWVSFHLWI